jgi:methylthioribose-1-phosphate isomerase
VSAQPALTWPLPTVQWQDGAITLIDQTRLPGQLVWRSCRDVEALCLAIRELAVRGAPAIGIAAGYGLFLAWNSAVAAGKTPAGALAALEAAVRQLAATRPTAVNLVWALERVGRVAAAACAKGLPVAAVGDCLHAEADAILAEDLARSRAIGTAGAALLSDPAAVLTHCNAGALATGGYGTALGVVYAALEQGKRVRVYADETRPLLQGARLTAWELLARGVEVTLLCDGAAGSLLASGRVDAVVVGADRIAGNGDSANKIGTYPLAVLARRHGVPFYVAAPVSTFDPATPDGAGIVVEERAQREVLFCSGTAVAPAGVRAWNPAFDVTPAELVTAFVTEEGVIRPPFAEALARFVAAADPHRVP